MLDFIMEVEVDGFRMDDENHIKHLQSMIDSGIVWKLQGWWGRLAVSMIEAGVVNNGERNA